MKTHIVIPIGVSQPGTPVLSLLEKSILSIQAQTSNDYILTIAADDNISEECKQLLIDKKVDVKWFSPASFFRKGGIWKKITETWKDTDTEFISFMHYDDLWDSNKLKLQVDEMKEQNLNSSWSEVYVINENNVVVSGDCSYYTEFDKSNLGQRSTAQAHSIIIKRKEFFESGIMQYENLWSPVFEDLFILYCNKIGNGKKVNGAKFYWRNHSMNMSNSILSDPALAHIKKEQNLIGDYSESEINEDIKFMHSEIQKIANSI